MKELVLTATAIRALCRIVLSCEVLHVKKDEQHEAFLVEAMKKRRPIRLAMLLSKFGKSIDLYAKLEEFTRDLGVEKIDSSVIYKFFGGQDHANKIVGDLNSPDFPITAERAKHKLLFVHMVIPVKISSTQPSIRGVYYNGDVTVHLQDLASFKDDDFQLEQVVLTHFGLIIDSRPSEELVTFILKTQLGVDKFWEAVRYFGHGQILDIAPLARCARFTLGKYGL